MSFFSNEKHRPNLVEAWYTNVLETAGLPAETLTRDELDWLGREIADRVESVRLDARGVQRALASRLQEALIAHPETFGEVREAAALAAAIKAKSLQVVREALETEVLP